MRAGVGVASLADVPRGPAEAAARRRSGFFIRFGSLLWEVSFGF